MTDATTPISDAHQREQEQEQEHSASVDYSRCTEVMNGIISTARGR